MEVRLFNIQHFSLDDGPGIRTVVFFQGCPLDCVWCHNPEGKFFSPRLAFAADRCVGCGACVEVCPKGAHAFSEGVHRVVRRDCEGCGRCAEVCLRDALELYGKLWTVDGVMEELAKDDLFFADGGGVTFSGGEPFAQGEALLALLRRCKEKGYSTCIETSGVAAPEALRRAAEDTDLFLFDWKETDTDLHRRFTGRGNEEILGNLALLNLLGKEVVLRCPIVPGKNDREDHLEGIVALTRRFSCIASVQVMAYHALWEEKARRIGAPTAEAFGGLVDAQRVEACRAYLKERGVCLRT